MIPVTKSFIPPIDEYQEHVSRAFHNQWLTNRGRLVKELEVHLAEYLSLNDSQTLLTCNGTIPIQIALKILASRGEVITTPFSYVATLSSIVWENCTPVFVDIDPKHLTIDETQIEKSITSKTTCILATHVFGNPCNLEELERVSKKNQIPVIYDAAHCFGVKYNGKSIFEFGDISTCSFHATKLFHTAEGGGIFCSDPALRHKIFYSHNFGHDGPIRYHGLGINAKMSELQAAMGLTVLPYVKDLIFSRSRIVSSYLDHLEGTNLQFIQIREGTEWNYSYFPVIFKSKKELVATEKALISNSVFPRRYFYPSLNTLPYVKYQKMQSSESISERILCLPLYADLPDDKVALISELIRDSLSL